MYSQPFNKIIRLHGNYLKRKKKPRTGGAQYSTYGGFTSELQLVRRVPEQVPEAGSLPAQRESLPGLPVEFPEQAYHHPVAEAVPEHELLVSRLQA